MNMRKLIVASAALGFALASHAAFAADVEKGEKVFNRCRACHSIDAGKNLMGPSLHGIVGRKSGTAENYKYSEGMSKAGLTWDEANLDRYLKDPKAVVPGNKMAFPGVKDDAERADLIAFLAAKAK